MHLPDKEIPYEELFYRRSEVIVLHARTVELVDRGYQDVLVRLSPSVLEIGEEKMNPDDVPCLEAVSTEIVLPREAMGLGDVKFMGAIGAFLGWQGVMFSLMLSSMIGAVVGVTLIVMRRRAWSSRMPYGPYIALAAAIWIFGGKKLFHALFAHVNDSDGNLSLRDGLQVVLSPNAQFFMPGRRPALLVPTGTANKRGCRRILHRRSGFPRGKGARLRPCPSARM